MLRTTVMAVVQNRHFYVTIVNMTSVQINSTDALAAASLPLMEYALGVGRALAGRGVWVSVRENLKL